MLVVDADSGGLRVGLDGREIADLDFAGVVKLAMQPPCSEYQVHHGQIVQIADVINGPIVAKKLFR